LYFILCINKKWIRVDTIYPFYMNFEVARNFKIHIKKIYGDIILVWNF